MTLTRKVVLILLRLLCNIFLSWKVSGQENVPMTGPLVLVSNHIHLMDTILIPVSFPRWINFMAKKELFRNPLLGFILRWAGAFPILRQGVVGDKRDTMRHAMAILGNGEVLGMFPEGKRNSDGVLSRGKAGPAVIALKAGVPLISVAVSGTENLKGISWLWKRPHITISIGETFSLPAVKGKIKRTEMNSLTDLMMKKIAVMLPEGKQGMYGD
jgi:1-acyl-sn-glycerol-3-phosphate acyltransferase